MKRIRPHVKYQGISLAVPFIAEIRKHVMFNPRYSSIADFVREATREKMQRDQSEAMEVFHKIYKRESDEELVKEIKNHKEFNGYSLEELKEGVAFVRELKDKEIKELHDLDELKMGVDYVRGLKQKKKKELPQEKKEPVVQLSKSELTDMIQNVVTETLNKKEKKLE